MRRLMSRLRSDEGVSLMEVIIAITVFALVSLGVLQGLLGSVELNRDSRARQTAANLAAAEIDEARSTADFSSLTGSTEVVTADTGVFTVLRTVTPSFVGGSASACDGGSNTFLQYKLVRVKVTWPGMGNTEPIRSDTVLTPSAGSFDPEKGNLGVKVLDQSGNAVEGVQVAASSASGSRTEFTDSAGCAFLDQLTPDTYTVVASLGGYVAPSGVAAPTTTSGVLKGVTKSVAFDLAPETTLEVALPETPFPAPIDVPVTIGNNGLQPDGTLVTTGSGTPRALTGRYPFSSGYTLWAGSCADADPLGTDGAGDPYYPSSPGRGAAMPAEPGVTNSGSVVMPAVTVQVLDGLGLPVADASVSVEHASDAESCTSGETYDLGKTDPLGELRASLPWGTWTIKVSGPVNETSTQTFEPGTAAYTAVVVGS